MSDIVRDPYGNPLSRDKLIAALRAEVERLRAALRDIATGQVTYLPFIQTVARAALAEKESTNDR